MVEFTEEQERAIKDREQKATEAAEHRLAFAQAFRLALPYLEGLSDQVNPENGQIIKRGAISPYIVEAFRDECNKVIVKLFPQPVPAEEKNPEE